MRWSKRASEPGIPPNNRLSDYHRWAPIFHSLKKISRYIHTSQSDCRSDLIVKKALVTISINEIIADNLMVSRHLARILFS